MSIDAMKQALTALEQYTDVVTSVNDPNSWVTVADGGKPAREAITALRERLAQPDAYGYASRLAVAIWEQHYKDVAPQWKPLDDLLGVLTQIDNMTSGLTRLAQPNDFNPDWDAMAVMVEEQQRMAKRIAELEAQPEQEPVAWVGPSWLNPETRTWESESFAPGPINGWSPLYTAPRQWQGLTDEEINSLWDGHVVPVFGKNGINPIVFARAIEAKLREKNA